jgi:hypothetical protein
MSRLLLTAAVIAALGLAGCMEVEQSATGQKMGKYQGKPDGKSWENDPLAYGNTKWKKGDKADWENQLKTRNNGQNEYVRIGH